jgi:hypothetical protein
MAKFKIGSLAKYAAAASMMMLATQGDALAQHQEIEINANTPGVTTGSSTVLFGGGGTRNYVATFFTPSATRSYIFGQRQSTIDSVIEIYQGSFNPTSNSNVLLGSDDDGYSSAMNTPGGYASGSVNGFTGAVNCGGTVQAPSPNLCPQLSIQLTSGQRITLVVTSFSANVQLGFPQIFYTDGPGTFTADDSQVAPSAPAAPAGPDMLYTVIAVSLNELGVRSVILRHATATTNALDYDCSVFDTNNVCVSVGARYGQLGSDNNEFTGLFTAAYRVTNEIRLGLFADHRFSGTTPDGMRLRNNTPIFGGFAVYQENADTSGFRFRASVAYQEAQLRVTRSELTNTEPGQGTSTLGSLGFGAEVSYGLRDANGWVFAPYAGIRRLETSRGRYTETTSDSVEFPLSYNRFGQYVTSGITGVRVQGPIADGLTFVAGAGLEYDLNSRLDAYSGTSTVPGLAGFSVTTDENAHRLRAVGSAGLRYAVASNQQLMLDAGVRETPYSDKPNITTMVRYAIGF